MPFLLLSRFSCFWYLFFIPIARKHTGKPGVSTGVKPVIIIIVVVMVIYTKGCKIEWEFRWFGGGEGGGGGATRSSSSSIAF